MSDNLRDRIAAVWLQHDGPYSQYKPDTDLMRLACDCGWIGETDEYTEYANHFADILVRELPELTYGDGHLHCGEHEDADRCPCPCCEKGDPYV